MIEIEKNMYLTILGHSYFQLVFLNSVLKINSLTKCNKRYLICYRLKIVSIHKIRFFFNNMYNNLICLGHSERP